MIKGYYKLESLTDEVKAQNKIKVGAVVKRLDCTAYSGDYRGLEPFYNSKGQLFFYLIPSRELVETHSKRYAEYCLSAQNLNFGSIYKFSDFPCYAYSYPNKNLNISNSVLQNPLFPYSNDLYLMIKSHDYSTIEILIIEGGRNLAEHYLQCLIEGEFNTELEKLRLIAVPMFQYNGYHSSNSKQ